MKHNFIRRVISVMLSCSVMVLGSVNVSSEEITVSNALGVYERKFELLNEKYGTDFQIATFNMTEAELNDLLTGYSKMTDEEFEAYFLDMKEKSDRFLEEQSENHAMMYRESNICSIDDILRNGGKITICNVETGVVEDITRTFPQDINDTSYDAENSTMENIAIPYSPNVEEYQLCFYDSNYNALCFDAYVNYSAGWGQYVSVIGYGEAIVNYPAYKVDSNGGFTCTFNSYYQRCDAVCNFPVYLYVSEGVVSGTLRNKSVTFTAGWGDIYEI